MMPVNFAYATSNCGFLQISGLHPDCRRIVQDIWEFRGSHVNLYLFSDHVEESRAQKLAEYIEKNSLGECQESKQVGNPVHNGRKIHAFFFYPNWKNIEAWCKKIKAKEKEEDDQWMKEQKSLFDKGTLVAPAPSAAKPKPPNTVRGTSKR